MICPPHHWLLDPPSPGITRVDAHCKRCDATRDYRPFPTAATALARAFLAVLTR